jgi:hypothetical protein
MASIAPDSWRTSAFSQMRADRQPGRRSMFLPLAVLAGLTATSTAAVASEPASKMLSDCKNKWHICNLVLYGATRMHGYMGKTNGAFVFCPPSTHDLTVTRQIGITYFQAHPELMNRPDIEVFSMAMANSFPCGKTQ